MWWLSSSETWEKTGWSNKVYVLEWRDANVDEEHHQQIRPTWWTMLEDQTRPSPKNKENFVDLWFEEKVKSKDSKEDIPRIKVKPSPRLINPPFNLLKHKHQRLS